MNRVDVIVPCYNYGRFLRECVESVLSQPVDVRVLIIDDASTDETPQVGAELASRDNRVLFRRHPINRGNIATYNEGIDWAAAPYMLLISADDMLFPDALLRATRVLDQCPEVGLTFGRVVLYQSGEPLPQPRTEPGEVRFRICTGLKWLEDICKEEGNNITTPDVVVRTSLQKKLGGYRAELPHSGDIEMFIRFALRSSIGVIDADQAMWRQHGDNMHKARDWHLLNLAKDRRNAFREAFRNFGNGTKEERRLEQIAYHSIVRTLLWKACNSLDQGDDAIPGTEILDFAIETLPRAHAFREYWALRLRWICNPRLWSILHLFFSRQRCQHSSGPYKHRTQLDLGQ